MAIAATTTIIATKSEWSASGAADEAPFVSANVLTVVTRVRVRVDISFLIVLPLVATFIKRHKLNQSYSLTGFLDSSTQVLA